MSNKWFSYMLSGLFFFILCAYLLQYRMSPKMDIANSYTISESTVKGNFILSRNRTQVGELRYYDYPKDSPTRQEMLDEIGLFGSILPKLGIYDFENPSGEFYTLSTSIGADYLLCFGDDHKSETIYFYLWDKGLYTLTIDSTLAPEKVTPVLEIVREKLIAYS